jgi:hypothetical protein
MALPPVTVRISGNVDDLLAKVEAAKAAIDDLDAKAAESQAATKGGGLGPAGGATPFSSAKSPLEEAVGRQQAGADKAWANHLASMKTAHGELGRGVL